MKTSTSNRAERKRKSNMLSGVFHNGMIVKMLQEQVDQIYEYARLTEAEGPLFAELARIKRESARTLEKDIQFFTEKSRKIMAAIEAVEDEELRFVLIQHGVLRRGHEEIAQELNCSLGTATKRYSQALDALDLPVPGAAVEGDV